MISLEEKITRTERLLRHLEEDEPYLRARLSPLGPEHRQSATAFAERVRAEAEAEMEEAHDFYEGRQTGLGDDFVARVQRVFDRTSANPRMHRSVYADIRQAGLTRFPYSVFYREDSTRIEVIAVFHDSRDPSVWQGRV